MVETYYNRKEKFNKYFRKFEKCNNRKNYYKLTNYLLAKTVKGSGIFKNFKILMTDKNNILFFNSTLGNDNTYENYKNGKIRYDGKLEEKINNRSEKYGYCNYVKCRTFYHSLKIGSNLQIIYEEIEENPGLSATIFLFLMAIIIIFGAEYFLIDSGTGTITSNTGRDVAENLRNSIESTGSENSEDLEFFLNENDRLSFTFRDIPHKFRAQIWYTH